MMLFAFTALALSSLLGIVGASRVHRYPGYSRRRLLVMAGYNAFAGVGVGALVYLLFNKLHAGVVLVALFAGINFMFTSVLLFRVSRSRGKTIPT